MVLAERALCVVGGVVNGGVEITESLAARSDDDRPVRRVDLDLRAEARASVCVVLRFENDAASANVRVENCSDFSECVLTEGVRGLDPNEHNSGCMGHARDIAMRVPHKTSQIERSTVSTPRADCARLQKLRAYFLATPYSCRRY